MSAIPASSVSLKTMADGTLRVSFDIEPSQAQDAFRLFAAPGTQVAIAALRDGSFLEQTSQVDDSPLNADQISAKPLIQKEKTASTTRAHMGDACLRTVQWCKDPSFWHWISSLRDSFGSCTSENAAKLFIQETCNVESRRELDTDNEANKAWNREIREPYRLWLLSRVGR